MDHSCDANRSIFMGNLNEEGNSFSNLNDNKFIDMLLYANDKFDDKKNRSILISSITLIKVSQSSDEPLLQLQEDFMSDVPWPISDILKPPFLTVA